MTASETIDVYTRDEDKFLIERKELNRLLEETRKATIAEMQAHSLILHPSDLSKAIEIGKKETAQAIFEDLDDYLIVNFLDDFSRNSYLRIKKKYLDTRETDLGVATVATKSRPEVNYDTNDIIYGGGYTVPVEEMKGLDTTKVSIKQGCENVFSEGKKKLRCGVFDGLYKGTFYCKSCRGKA